MTNHASKIGADGALIITPYYNKPTQRGLIEHYTSIHNNTNIDIVIYNVPGRTSINIEDKTISELANLQRISGVKDATGDLARVYILKSMLPKNKPFSILSGEDMTVVPFNAAGGHGVISVTSNILPNMCKQIQSLSLSSKIKEANELQSSIITLNNLLFKETNPIVIKWVCSLVGLCEKEIRLPLTQPSEALQEAVKVELAKLSVI
jgi:4-hydroxy-tetrahydrodipicolinate synthase